MRKLAVTLAVGLGVTMLSCSPTEQSPSPKPPAPAAEEPPSAAPAAIPVAEAPKDDGVRGYVISAWRDEIPRKVDASWCPEGLNPSELEHYGVTREELSEAYKKGGGEAADALFPGKDCIEPTTVEDPGFKLVQGTATIAGLDLDGTDSRADTEGDCAHDDFTGPNGETGIDNQHWRLMGCVAAYQPGGLIDNLYHSGGFVKSMGAPVLLELTGVDDLQNDDAVELRVFSSSDPTTFDGTGSVMRDTTMAIHEDPRFHSNSVPAKIENGILTSEPIQDLRIKVKTQTMDNEFYYKDARIRAEVADDGSLKGILAGYWDGENLWDSMNTQYIGDNHVGRIAAISRGYMCSGLYHAIPRVADGHPDPETGKCTSVSHAVHFEAVPTFVIRPQIAKAEG